MDNAPSFERGWMKAIAHWKDGFRLEEISAMASAESASGAHVAARGMVAAVEAMGGWLDVARRDAKVHGLPEALVEDLIARAVAA